MDYGLSSWKTLQDFQCKWSINSTLYITVSYRQGYPGGKVIKNSPVNAGGESEVGLIPGSGRSLGEGNGNPLQYSCLDNAMDKGAWWTVVHGSCKSWTWLSAMCMHTRAHTHTYTVTDKFRMVILRGHQFFKKFLFSDNCNWRNFSSNYLPQ